MAASLARGPFCWREQVRREGAGGAEPSLDRRYGKIGISAVAAALPYQSDAKNAAYALVTPRDHQRRAEAAECS